MNFNDLGINNELEAGLEKLGITAPMPIQVEAIPKLIPGTVDAFIGSETGSGKTLAYLLPIITQLDLNNDNIQALVIAPTHELVLQIHQQLVDLAQRSEIGFRSIGLIGSVAIKRQREKLKKKPHIVIGSPGRVIELIKTKKLKIHQTKTFVIDEMDKLLEGAMLESVEVLKHALSRDVKQIFVSAATGKGTLKTAKDLAPDLIEITAFTNKTNADITHLYFETESRKKTDLVRKIIHASHSNRLIVFTHLIESANLLTEKLKFHKIKAMNIHRDCTKKERQIALAAFRSGKTQVLVSSDASARGLDIEGVTHVINLDPPSQNHAYVHRVGRTGRAGAKGTAITFIEKHEKRLIHQYEKSLKIKFQKAIIREGSIILED